MDRSKLQQRPLATAALLAFLILFVRLWPSPPPSAPLPAPSRPAVPERARSVPAPLAPPPPSAPHARSESPVEAANRQLAEALGLGWVSCPQPTLVQTGWMDELPSGFDSDRFYFSTTRPSGLHLLRKDDEVVGVVRWSVEADGTSTRPRMRTASRGSSSTTAWRQRSS